jgi:hypothetical protein
MGKLQAGTRRPCEACGTEMVGAVHSKTGKVAPIVVEPADNGNILLWRASDGTLSYSNLPPETCDLLRDLGVPLRLNHFADCPQRERFAPAAS